MNTLLEEKLKKIEILLENVKTVNGNEIQDNFTGIGAPPGCRVVKAENALTFKIKDEKLDEYPIISFSFLERDNNKLSILFSSQYFNFNIPEDLELTIKSLQNYLDECYIGALRLYEQALKDLEEGTKEVDKFPGLVSYITEKFSFKSLTITEFNVDYDTSTIYINVPGGYSVRVKYKQGNSHKVVLELLKNNTLINTVKEFSIERDSGGTFRVLSKIRLNLEEVVKPISL